MGLRSETKIEPDRSLFKLLQLTAVSLFGLVQYPRSSHKPLILWPLENTPAIVLGIEAEVPEVFSWRVFMTWRLEAGVVDQRPSTNLWHRGYCLGHSCILSSANKTTRSESFAEPSDLGWLGWVMGKK